MTKKHRKMLLGNWSGIGLYECNNGAYYTVERRRFSCLSNYLLGVASTLEQATKSYERIRDLEWPTT